MRRWLTSYWHKRPRLLSRALTGPQNSSRAGAATVMLLTAGLVLSRAAAQDYSIDWFTMDGGGGTSTGSGYAVSGTVGQPDAGAMSGGPFRLTGGFWSIVTAIPTPGAPVLSLIVANSTVVISWPQPASGWVLEWTPALVPPPGTNEWMLVNPPYQTRETNWIVTLPWEAGHKYFRLRKP